MGSPSGAVGDDAAEGRGYVSTVSSRAPGLRVAMVIQRFRPHFSGQGRQVELLCRELVKRGLKPTVITSAYGNPTSEETVDGYTDLYSLHELSLSSVLTEFLTWCMCMR